MGGGDGENTSKRGGRIPFEAEQGRGCVCSSGGKERVRQKKQGSGVRSEKETRITRSSRIQKKGVKFGGAGRTKGKDTAYQVPDIIYTGGGRRRRWLGSTFGPRPRPRPRTHTRTAPHRTAPHRTAPHRTAPRRCFSKNTRGAATTQQQK